MTVWGPFLALGGESGLYDSALVGGIRQGGALLSVEGREDSRPRTGVPDLLRSVKS